MKFLLQLDRKIYIFAFYVFFMIFWITEELLTIYLNITWIRSSQKLLTTMEICMAVLSLYGLYYIYQELKLNKEDADTAKDIIEKLKHQNHKLNQLSISFWETVQAQMVVWGLTEMEKETAIYILRGLSNQQIAAVRGKSLKTIENQSFSIYQKSGTTGKLEFIAYFISPLLPDED